MAPDKPEGRPRQEAPSRTISAPTTDTTAMVTRPGCPCGCATRPPWLDDPGCLYEAIRIGASPVKVLTVQRRVVVLTADLLRVLEGGNGDAAA